VELIDQITGNLVGLDTSVIISYIADEAPFAEILAPIFTAIEAGNLIGVTPTISLTESLVHPFRSKDTETIQLIKEMLLESENILTIDLNSDIAEEAAKLRAQHQLKTPDAIQLATAIHAGAQTFLTNDKRLRSLPAIKVVVVQDFVTK